MRVLEVLNTLFCSKYGCDPENVEMAASLDGLNIAPHEREDMAMFLEELYGVEIDDSTLEGFETVEDVVGFIEDTWTGEETG
ncbi:MAG: hypothetical protein IJ518_01845 [Clostridia bacterium]|nr:hypothetical protein [Clostridia bacterium]